MAVQTEPTPPGVAAAEATVLMFLVAGKQFAVDLDRVQQILEYQPPTRTPRRPPNVEGIIRHKGRYLPLVSLRRRLGVEEPGSTSSAILLLSSIGRDPLVGLTVDQVLRVLLLAPDKLPPPPPRVFGIRVEFIRGVGNAGGRPVVWLDVVKLLTSDEPITLLA
ncbi:MAG: chemotaxis protein CheW [candidate division NC10 bacterium]|nr:chemotaxis protein CheW [candidate division NC10 bacterium]